MVAAVVRLCCARLEARRVRQFCSLGCHLREMTVALTLVVGRTPSARRAVSGSLGAIIEQRAANLLYCRLLLTRGVKSNVPINFIVCHRASVSISLVLWRGRARESWLQRRALRGGTGMEPTYLLVLLLY